MAIEFEKTPDGTEVIAPLERSEQVLHLPVGIYRQLNVWSVQCEVEDRLRRFFSGVSIYDCEFFANNFFNERFRDSPLYGVFTINTESAEHIAFLNKCREDTNEFNKVLDDLLRERQLPITCRRNPTGLRSDMIRLWVSIDPPFLSTPRKIHGSEANRARAKSPKGIYFHIHQDKYHVIQHSRVHKMERDGYRLEDMRGNLVEFLEELTNSTTFADHYGDWHFLAEMFVDIIEKFFNTIDQEDVDKRGGALNEFGRKKIVTLGQLEDEWGRDIEGNSLYGQKYPLHLLLKDQVCNGLKSKSPEEEDLVRKIIELSQKPLVRRMLELDVTEQVIKTMLVGIRADK